MSQMVNTVYRSFVAGQAFTDAHRWHFVKLDGPNTVVLAGADDVVIGVLTDFVTGNEGTPVTVAIAGTVKVKTTAGFAQNAFVGSGAGGVAASGADVVRGLS